MKILIIDSGIGGLSVYNYLNKKYPNNEYTYLMDNYNFPYGTKTQKEIYTILTDQIKPKTFGYDYIIIACNTLSISLVKNQCELLSPTINMLDLHKIESKKVKNKNVTILCTKNSKESNIWNMYYDNPTIISGEYLANYIEDNNFKNINNFINNIPVNNPVILSCTHYNFVSRSITNSIDITKNIDFLINFTDSIKSFNIIFTDVININENYKKFISF